MGKLVPTKNLLPGNTVEDPHGTRVTVTRVEGSLTHYRGETMHIVTVSGRQPGKDGPLPYSRVAANGEMWEVLKG